MPSLNNRLPNLARPVIFIGSYLILNRAYFEIPNEILSDTVYFHGLSRVCAGLVNLAGPSDTVAAVGNHLASPLADLEIIRGCDGAGTLFLIIAAMLAFPASLPRKLGGILLGVGLMYGLNIVRISSLYFLMAYRPEWFELVHTYVAPGLIIAIGCLFFAGWASASGKAGLGAA